MALFGSNGLRAWIKAQNNGVVLSSYGVSSINDLGTGFVRINLNTNLGNSNYSINPSYSQSGNTNPNRVAYITSSSVGNTSFEIKINSATGGVNDPDWWFCSVHHNN